MTIVCNFYPGGTSAHIGYSLNFLDEYDPNTAIEQFNKGYAHGGGWDRFEGFVLNDDKSIKYPGAPALPIRVEIAFRDERIYIYDHAWFLVVKADSTYEIARMN